MIAELYTLLSSIDANKTKSGGYRVNLNRNRIRSISAFSSNSIFYFNTVVSDQVMPEEMGMVSRMLEKSYASFVVACIGLMPFHRVHADDQAAIESYLSQFHQNLGNGAANAAISGVIAGQVATALNTSVQPDSDDLAITQDFLMECWEKSRRDCNRFVNIVSETVSLNDMYSVDPIDPVTRVIQEQYRSNMEELDEWGFIGEATVEMLDEFANSIMNELTDAEIEQLLMGYGDDDEYYDDEDGDGIPDDEDDDYDWVDDELDEVTNRDVHKFLTTNPVTKAYIKGTYNFVTSPVGQALAAPGMTVGRAMANTREKLGYGNVAGNQRAKDMGLDDLDDEIADLKAKGIIKEAAEKDNSSNITSTLASITDNKIKSCQSLGKLHGMEARLTKLKNKYASYLNRYKRKWKENKKKGSKAKLRMQFNGMSIGNPKEFMQKFGASIKLINKRLASVNKRQDELRKRKGIEVSPKLESATNIPLDDVDLQRMDECLDMMDQMLNDPPFEYEMIDESSSGSRGTTDVDFSYDTSRPMDNINPRRVAAAAQMKDYKRSDTRRYDTFDREIFTKMDMEKANEAVPTFAKAKIGFIIDETEEVVNRDVLVGIKVQLHVVPAKDLINDMYQCLINKRKFLRFVKWYSGEEKSLADLLFGFKELRTDALNNRAGGAGQWGAAFRQRKRWSKMSVPFLMKEYTPNGTVVFTMNEVQFIRDEYGIDVMNPTHVKMLMEASFLLGFVVLDQANELCYVTYDGHEGQFQQYTYAMLERENRTTDRAMRELYRAMAR